MLHSMLTLALQGAGQGAQGAAAGGVFAAVASIWCCGGVLGIGQLVIFIIALIQILQRNMPSNDKLLWVLVCMFLPLIGPILWWTIGSKQHPPPPPPPPGGPPMPPSM